MKNWKDIHTKEQLRTRYASYIPALQKVAMQCGYALAVHGSMTRDLDLVAVPWVPNAYAPESLVIMLERAWDGATHTRNYWKNEGNVHSEKPHGRKAFILWLATLADDFEGTSGGGMQRHAMIDLSVMPRLPRPLKVRGTSAHLP